MSSGEYGASSEIGGQVCKRFEAFRKEVFELGQPDKYGNDRMQDPGHQAYVHALYPKLGDYENYPDVNRYFNRIVQVYSERSDHNLVQNAARSGAAYYLRKYYPRDLDRLGKLDNPEEWEEYFWVLEHDIKEQAHLALHFDFNVQTTVAQRAAPVVAAIRLLDRQGPHKILDIGHGGGHPLAAMALRPAVYAFDDMRVFERDPATSELVYNSRASSQLATFINQPIEIGESIGLDIEDERGPRLSGRMVDDNRLRASRYGELQEWIGQCLYLIKERVNNPKAYHDLQLMEEYKRDLKQISFFQADVTAMDDKVHEAFQARFPGFIATTALFLTVCNQLREEGTYKARENIKPYIDPKSGLIVTQDFADFEADGTIHLIEGSWPAWSYKTYVEDNAQPEKGVQHFFSLRNGRCRDIIFEKAAGRLAVSHGIELMYME